MINVLVARWANCEMWAYTQHVVCAVTHLQMAIVWASEWTSCHCYFDYENCYSWFEVCWRWHTNGILAFLKYTYIRTLDVMLCRCRRLLYRDRDDWHMTHEDLPVRSVRIRSSWMRLGGRRYQMFVWREYELIHSICLRIRQHVMILFTRRLAIHYCTNMNQRVRGVRWSSPVTTAHILLCEHQPQHLVSENIGCSILLSYIFMEICAVLCCVHDMTQRHGDIQRHRVCMPHHYYFSLCVVRLTVYKTVQDIL